MIRKRIAATIFVVSALVGCSNSDDGPQDTPSEANGEATSATPAPQTSAAVPSPTPNRDTVYADDDEDWYIEGPILVNRRGFGWGETVTVLFPGVGTQDVDNSVFEGREIVEYGMTGSGAGDSATFAIAAAERVPADGLDPESFQLVILEVDSDGDVEVTMDAGVVQLEERPESLSITGSPSGRLAIDVDETVFITDERASQVVKTFENAEMEAAYGGVGLTFDDPDPGVIDDCDSPQIIWLEDPETMIKPELERDYQCYEKASSVGSLVWTMVYYDSTRDQDAWESEGPSMDVLTGKELKCRGGDRYDTTSRLSVGPKDEAGGDREIAVTDCVTGKQIWSLEEERQLALEAEVGGIVDGIVYLRTTDQMVAVNPRTGEDSPVSTYPLARLGDFLWYSDGRIAYEPYENR